jgi:hypothetical protein
MKIIFQTIGKSIFILFLSCILWSACKNENQTAQQTPISQPQAAPSEAPLPKTTVSVIDFPHFGQYDLTSWEKIPTKNMDEGGDVTTTSVAYKKDGMTMTIDTLQSEYYFEIQHTLKDNKGIVQKMRSLHFSNDPQELTETVNDYTLKPAKKYSRKQKFDKSYQQLTAIPTMVTGEWLESAADKL